MTDAAKKRELWNSVVEAWFPDGPDDDGVVLLKVEADSAEYWDSPGGRVATAISFAKAKLTGERYSTAGRTRRSTSEPQDRAPRCPQALEPGRPTRGWRGGAPCSGPAGSGRANR